MLMEMLIKWKAAKTKLKREKKYTCNEDEKNENKDPGRCQKERAGCKELSTETNKKFIRKKKRRK